MSLKIVTSFAHLCRLARAEHEARASGDAAAIELAAARHEEYRQICLAADEMIIPPTRSIL